MADGNGSKTRTLAKLGRRRFIKIASGLTISTYLLSQRKIAALRSNNVAAHALETDYFVSR